MTQFKKSGIIQTTETAANTFFNTSSVSTTLARLIFSRAGIFRTKHGAQKMKRFLVLLMAILPISALAQDCPPGFNCPPRHVEQPIEQFNLNQWYTKFTGPRGRQPSAAEVELSNKIKFSAVRIYQGNGCGSGSLVGRDEKFIYIQTNAHVSSTVIGSQSRCQAIVDGKLQEFRGSLIEVAYSSRERVDWGLLRADVRFMAGIKPVPMAKFMPDAKGVTVLWGHPRCVPTQGRALQTVSLSRVWFKEDNSIGGESGSAIVQSVNGDPVQVGLTTWSEMVNGRWLHSSQFTASIFEQSQNKNNRGEPRSGFEKVPEFVDDNPLGVVLADCYAREVIDNPLGVHLEDKWACIGNAREVALRNYPIWYEPKPPTDPVDPVDPVEPCPPTGLTDGQKAKLESAKKLIDEVLKK